MQSYMDNLVQTAQPTTSTLDEWNLAAALGYPLGWRVCRKISPVNGNRPVDIIFAGNPKKGVDAWVHHEAARKVAAKWLDPDAKGKPNPYASKGGHFLPRQPKFQKGDSVEVMYKKEWYLATVTKRRESAGEFLYTVEYTEDDSTQADIREKKLRRSEANKEAENFAIQLGFTKGWQASVQGKSRYTIISPDQQKFRSKKAALAHMMVLQGGSMGGAGGRRSAVAASSLPVLDQGDPPWRRSGHDVIGRKLRYVTTHKLSGKRTVDLVQIGIVTGWISETDVDSSGESGYICEATGRPADLFHVEFADEPGHPYAKYLLDNMDVEWEEIVEKLLDEDQVEEQPAAPPKKRARRR